MAQVRILVIDDHDLFREGLKRLLEAEADFKITGSCASISEGFAVLDREAVDIVLLDYELGNENGTQFLDGLRERNQKIPVLMVTAGIRDDVTIELLTRGTSGIFFKQSPPEQLIEAIRLIVSGQTWLEARVVRTLLASAAEKKEQPRTQKLNERERIVLMGVFEGLSNRSIAEKLHTTEGTVKTVMQQLFDKTGVRTRSQLVRIAIEKRIQEWPPDRDSL